MPSLPPVSKASLGSPPKTQLASAPVLLSEPRELFVPTLLLQRNSPWVISMPTSMFLPELNSSTLPDSSSTPTMTP